MHSISRGLPTCGCAHRTQARARWQLALGAAGPVCIAALMPSPGSQLALLADARAEAVIGAIAMLLAIATTWSLVAWTATISVAAFVSGLPGVVGRLGSGLLRLTTPVAMRRILAAAAGVSIAAGLAACGTTAAAGPGVPLATESSITTTTATPSPSMPSLADTAPSDFHLDLDWPAKAATSTPTVASAETTATDAAPTTDAPAIALPRPAPAAVADSEPTAVADSEPTAVADGEPAAVSPQQTSEQAPINPVTVTVEPGDCLWSIAAEHLPAGATGAEIDAEWRALYAANSAAIGPNPNLVIPGLVLRQPAAVESDAQPAAPHVNGGMR